MTKEASFNVEPIRIDWNRAELADAYDIIETLRHAIAQPEESSLNTSLIAALDAIEAADVEWSSITRDAA